MGVRRSKNYIDNDYANEKRKKMALAQERLNASNKIKLWYKEKKSQRIFKNFIDAVMNLKKTIHH